MAFWGVEVRPGKPFKLSPPGGKGRLHVSQATLGIGSATNKSIVQCNVGNKTPVFLCSLFPDKAESSQLNLEFEEADEVVFSVIGPRSVHITGFYMGNAQNSRMDDESESFGEDLKDTETDRSEDNDDYDDSFINDDDAVVRPPSPCFSDEDETLSDLAKPKKSRRLRKKYQVVSESESDSGDSPQLQNAVNGKGEVEEASDSDEAVGSFFKSLGKKPSSSKDKKEGAEKAIAIMANGDGLPSASDNHKSEDPAANIKREKKRKAQENPRPGEEKEQDHNPPDNKVLNNEPELDTAEEEPKAKKKKKKKKKSKGEAVGNDMDLDMETPADEKISSKENGDDESTRARTLPNGLVIEEIELGNPDGKVAAFGKKVSVNFTGKVKENGKVIDSNGGGEPLKFRLGSGEVMGGWDDGVDGMRVGGKRRLTIPHSLCKGSGRLEGKKIGSKKSLVYEIEVVRIR